MTGPAGLPGPNTRGWPRVPLLCCAAFLLVTLVACLLPPAMLQPVFGPPTWTPAALMPHVADRFFTWDAGWYDSIATRGYGWAGAGHGEQNIAFMPLWPLVLRGIYALSGHGAVGRAAVVAVTASLACLSILLFGRLAVRVLPTRQAAGWATAFYALSPAASFMLQSYPTALMNCLATACLLAITRRRYGTAAVVAGLATAAGPLMAALSVTVILAVLLDPDWRARPVLFGRRPALPWRAAAMLVAGLSGWGLAVFLLWSWAALGDPLAFVAAQSAWVHPLPFAHRLWTFVRLELVLPGLWDAARKLRDTLLLLRQGGAPEAQKDWEYALSLVGIAGYLGCSLVALGLRPRLLGFFGWFLTTAYVWLIATNLEGYGGLRLIYAASPASLGAALLLHRRPRVAGAALVASGLLLLLQTCLSFAGYWVV